MATRRILRQNRRLLFRRIRALFAGALVLGVGAALTVAAWTDQENAKATITAGTFAIESSVDGNNWASHDATALVVPLEATGLYPGVTKASSVQIRTRADSVPGTVSLTGIQSGIPSGETDTPNTILRAALRAWVFPVSESRPCSTAAVAGQGDSLTTLPNDATTPKALQANGGNVVTYCIVVRLSSDAASAAQGGEVTPTWTFTGTTGTTP